MSKITRNDFARQIDHIAVIAHGAHPEYRLEIDAPVSVDSGAAIRQGSVVSLNADGAYVLGCPAGTDQNYPVPAISLKNAYDPDVTAGTSGATYRTTTYAAVGGKITAIPCTGGYEIQTTEYDGVDSSFKPGDALSPAVSGGLVAKAAAAAYTSGSVIMGYVTSAPELNKTAGAKVLSFLTTFLPAGR